MQREITEKLVALQRLATDGLQIPAVTMTNKPLKPVEW